METSQQISDCLENLFTEMIKDGIILFPTRDQIISWEGILDEWIADKTLPLFKRKPAEGRGSQVIHAAGRSIMITDNSPAHWVYKTVVLNPGELSISKVRKDIANNNFPIAMMMKKSEKDFLLKSQVSKSSFQLGNEIWKVAHIIPIALSRKHNPDIVEYEKHHRYFLSLDNMYIIRKDFSGVAEVAMFNEIVKRHKEK